MMTQTDTSRYLSNGVCINAVIVTVTDGLANYSIYIEQIKNSLEVSVNLSTKLCPFFYEWTNGVGETVAFQSIANTLWESV